MMAKHYAHLTGKTRLPLNPVHRRRFIALLDRLNRVGELEGVVLTVASGYRSRAAQAALYAAYIAGRGNLAAKPGTSNHEKGQAADVYVGGVPVGANARVRRSLHQHGICFPVPGEKWHVEIGTTDRA